MENVEETLARWQTEIHAELDDATNGDKHPDGTAKGEEIFGLEHQLRVVHKRLARPRQTHAVINLLGHLALVRREMRLELRWAGVEIVPRVHIERTLMRQQVEEDDRTERVPGERDISIESIVSLQEQRVVRIQGVRDGVDDRLKHLKQF